MGRWFDSFGKKESEIPEGMRSLTFEQIQDAINAKATLETELGTVKAEAALKASEIAAVKGEFQTTKERLAALEANSGTRVQRTNDAATQKPGFLEDEEAAFSSRFAEQAGPLQAATLHSGALAAQSVFLQGLSPADKRIYTKYKGDFDVIMSRESAQRKIFPEVWANALVFVQGQKMQEILASKDEFFAEGAGANGGAGAQKVEPGDKDKLTEEQLEVAKRMGVSADDYKKAMGEVNIFTPSQVAMGV